MPPTKPLVFRCSAAPRRTFSGVPRFALSADVGYRWSQATFAGFEPRKIGVSLAGHWSLK